MTYIAQFLEELAIKLDEDQEKYSHPYFLVYKVLASIQRDIPKSSPYW